MQKIKEGKAPTSKFIKILGIEDIGFLPVDKDVCRSIGIDFNELLTLEFQISINKDRIVIEGRTPSTEQRPSNTPTMKAAKLTGVDWHN